MATGVMFRGTALFTVEREVTAFPPGSSVAFSVLPRWVGVPKLSIYSRKG
jgi:hypothetical protein